MTTTTKVPWASGLSYNDQESLVERVARAKAYQHRSIGYYDIDDLRQEVRIKCWEALTKFDPTCGTNIYAFLSVCAENRIRDIKRSVMYKHNKPCMRCPFWNAFASASGTHDCLVYSYKMDCERFARHERYVQAKLSASHPIDINGERLIDDCSDIPMSKFELMDFIDAHLPQDLRRSFEKFKQANYDPRVLKQRERSVLMRVLREILQRFEGEG